MTRKSSDANVDAQLQPARWVARPAGDESPEDRLAALLRASERPEGLSDASRARVLSRLTRPAPSPAPAPSSRRGSPVGLRWAIVMAMLLTSGGVIGAVTAHRWWPAVSTVDETPPDRTGPVKHRVRRARPPAAPTEMPDPTPAAEEPAIPAAAAPVVDQQPSVPAPSAIPPVAPPVAPVAVTTSPRAKTWPKPSVHLATSSPSSSPSSPSSSPSPSPAPTTIPPPTPAPPAPPTVLAYETRLLGHAVARLRQQRDATGALVALDVYQSQFPTGTLHHEADVTRVDALLMLGRERDALALLQTLRLQPQGRDQELRVIRGELAAATDCSRAISDFDRLLVQPAPAGLTERALYGRAVCRTRQGDTAGAGRDLGDYLRRFPTGRFAAEARRNLGQK